MQDFNNTAYTTSEQHKEAIPSGVERYLAKLSAKLEQYCPFSEEGSLRNINTGINAGNDVNAQDLFIEGGK